MEQKQVKALIAQCESIGNQTNTLLTKTHNLLNAKSKLIQRGSRKYDSDVINIDERINSVYDEVKSLVDYFNRNIAPKTKDCEIDSIYITSDKKIEPTLRQLLIECDRISCALDEDISALSFEESKKQEELRKEVAETCENLDTLYEENLNEALDELESGHFLASALITSRVVDYTLKQLKIQEDKQEIKSLIKNITEEKSDTILKQQTETISRLSRNLYNHRIDRFAKSSNAFSLLSDCLFLLDIYEKSHNNRYKIT